MQFAFVTNYYNHHQKEFAQMMFEKTNRGFTFIETEPISQERLDMGWGRDEKPSFVKQTYLSKENLVECQKLIDNADVVIWGSCPFNLIKPRLKKNKLTFAYSERLFKGGTKGIGFWTRVLKYFLRLKRYQKNHYLLAASAYATGDYNRIGLFINKAYKWGYFPKVFKYDSINDIIKNKQKNLILWAGRLIDLKHPEQCVAVAKELRNRRFNFEMYIIGTGPLQKNIEAAIQTEGLSDYVKMLGSMTPEKVRTYMEKAQIFLFTSDQNEGWGAVLNEAMNSGCAVVANKEIGSAPFLIDSKKNGILYSSNSQESLFSAVSKFIENKEYSFQCGVNAYESIERVWNAGVAAKRLITLSSILVEEKSNSIPWEDGPCSIAYPE